LLARPEELEGLRTRACALARPCAAYAAAEAILGLDRSVVRKSEF